MRKRFDFLIDMPVKHEWANIDLIRTSILNCFTAMFEGMDGCHIFAMVTGELLENAIKYGAWGAEDSRLHLRVWGQEQHATVQVENPIDGNGPAARHVMDTLSWIGHFDTAEEAYRARLLEAARAPRGAGTSRLGLTRIAYEGNCRLHAEVTGDVLRVTSEMSF